MFMLLGRGEEEEVEKRDDNNKEEMRYNFVCVFVCVWRSFVQFGRCVDVCS